MRNILHRFSIALLFVYICTVYICSYNTQLNSISHAAFIMLFGCTLFFIMLRGSLLFPKSLWFMFVFWATTIVSYYWIIRDTNVIQKHVTFFLLMLFVFIIVNIVVEEKSINTVLKMLYFAGIAMCLYSLFFYGYESTINALVVESNIRLGGEINQENVFGMICAITTVLGLYFAFYKGEGIYYFINLIPIVYAFTSGSRKVILIFFIALILLIINKRSKNFFMTILIWMLSATVIILIINFLTDQNLLIFERFNTFLNIFGEKDYNTVVDTSSITRMGMIKDGIKWFLEKPFLGYGTDQYAILHFENYGVYVYSHSNLIEVLVNHGLIGFSIYYSLYLYVLIKIIRGVKRKVDYSVGMLVLFSVLIVMNLFSVILYEKIHYILIGILLSYISINKDKLGKKPLVESTVAEEGK